MHINLAILNGHSHHIFREITDEMIPLALTIWSADSAGHDGFTRSREQGSYLMCCPWNRQHHSSSLRAETTCHNTSSHQEIDSSRTLVWFVKTLVGVICDESKRETNPFHEFRIIHLRWTRGPHGHSQESPNSLYQIDDNGC